MKIKTKYWIPDNPTPFGFAVAPAISKPVDKFGKSVYFIKLKLSMEEVEFEPFHRSFEKYCKEWEEETGKIVQNGVIYRAKDYGYIDFTSKNQPKCYNEDGDETEPPIDGDTVEIGYTIMGWDNGQKAGIKLILDNIHILTRSGKPIIVKNNIQENEDFDIF